MMTARLSAMMFLQYFVFGAWYVTAGNFMTASGMEHLVFWAYTVGPVAAVLSPFFLGLVADRYFSAERVLAVLSLLGAAAMFFAARIGGDNPPLFIALLLLHSLCYYPTVGLATSMAFHHVADRERQFPLVRAVGSIGWISAGIVVSGVLEADATATPFLWAAATGVLYAAYSLTLPHTPPSAEARAAPLRALVGFSALRRLSSPSFNVFILCSVLITIPLAAYNAYAPVFIAAAGIARPAFTLSFGQMVEVVIMFALPLILLRLGFKAMFVAGLAAWGLRYLLFIGAVPTGSVVPIFLGILMHGVCFDFVFIAGRMYVDRLSSPSIRGQAQGFMVVVTMGIGQLVGAPIAGGLFNGLVAGDVARLDLWAAFWTVPAVMSFAAMAGFWWFFRDPAAGT